MTSVVVNNGITVNKKSFHKILSVKRYLESNKAYIEEIISQYKEKGILIKDRNSELYAGKIDFEKLEVEPKSILFKNSPFQFAISNVELINDFELEDSKAVETIKVNKENKEFLNLLLEYNIIDDTEIQVTLRKYRNTMENVNAEYDESEAKKKVIKDYIDSDTPLIIKNYNKKLQETLDKKTKEYDLDFDNIKEVFYNVSVNNGNVLVNTFKTETFIEEWGYKEDIAKVKNVIEENLISILKDMDNIEVKNREQLKNTNLRDEAGFEKLRIEIENRKADKDRLVSQKENIIDSIDSYLEENLKRLHMELAENGSRIRFEILLKNIVEKINKEEFSSNYKFEYKI